MIARLLPASDQKDARLRATFVGSQLIGMAILRYIVKIEPLASADPELIAKFLGITIDRYLYKDINPPGAATQGDGPRNSAAGPYPSLPFKQGSGAMRKPPVRRDGGEHDDNRLAILHAACAELALHGYEGASVRSIARRARVDPRLVYYYFPSKTDLVIAALREHPGAADWTLGAFFASAEQGPGQESPYWSALIAGGLSTEQSVRAVFNGIIDGMVDAQVGGNPALRLQAQLAFGQVIGGWLLAGGASPLAGEDVRKWLTAIAHQRLAALALGG